MSSIPPPKPKAPPAPTSDAANVAQSANPKPAGQKAPDGRDQYEAAQAPDAQFQRSVQSEILPDNSGEKSAKSHAKGGHGKNPEDGIDPNDPSMQPVLTSKP